MSLLHKPGSSVWWPLHTHARTHTHSHSRLFSTCTAGCIIPPLRNKRFFSSQNIIFSLSNAAFKANAAQPVAHGNFLKDSVFSTPSPFCQTPRSHYCIIEKRQRDQYVLWVVGGMRREANTATTNRDFKGT